MAFLSSLIKIRFGCIIYAIVQQMWPSMWILIAMEAALVMICFGAGLIEGLLEIAQERLSILMMRT